MPAALGRFRMGSSGMWPAGEITFVSFCRERVPGAATGENIDWSVQAWERWLLLPSGIHCSAATHGLRISGPAALIVV